MTKSASIAICLIASVIALTIAFAQRRELASLRSQHSEQRKQAVEASKSVVPSAVSLATSQPPSLELLRLRGEVGRLERRKRELGGVLTEKEMLRTQLTTRDTNALRGITALPAGYLRKTDAKHAGFNTPEDTIQSMLWAIQNRDTATFCQVFNPEMAKHLEQEIQRRGSVEEFFKEANVMPGLRILKKENMDDGEVELTIEIVPGEEFPRPLYLKKFAGQWKLVSGL